MRASEMHSNIYIVKDNFFRFSYHRQFFFLKLKLFSPLFDLSIGGNLFASFIF